ncbi:MAG: methylated-DNA--[protein]-cysteine S-methyltransferase [Acholeplasmataceae bacterium]|nr:methylated-DNA--[protein]-cysteine S-methyltransferase [Acholeplasmataceae bacterium]
MIGRYQSPLGWIYFKTENDSITDLMIDNLDTEPDNDSLIKNIQTQLDLYFKHELKAFNLPIKYIKGTPFQKEVWDALLTIPYGETRTYQQIATQIGRPKSIRAVGQACKKNPVGIIVPCHRVIGKDGSMRGYSGPEHIDLKKKLLNHEKNKF